MTIELRKYMDYVEDNEDKFFDPWEFAFEELGGKKVLFCSSSYWGYGGSIDVDILLTDGRILSYEYNFDSCCDRFDYDHPHDKIVEDIKQHATFFDNMNQYNSWVNTLPNEFDGSENERKIFKGE